MAASPVTPIWNIQQASSRMDSLCTARENMDEKLPAPFLYARIWTQLENGSLALTTVNKLPSWVLSQFFSEAWRRRYMHLVKSIVPVWPFSHLILRRLTDWKLSEWTLLASVLDGIDVLLAQATQSRKGKLKLLNCMFNKSPLTWYGLGQYENSCIQSPVAEGRWRKQHPVTPLRVLVDIPEDDLSYGYFLYIYDWVRERKDVHLCCKKVTFTGKAIQLKILNVVELDCIEEMQMLFPWPVGTMETFAPLLQKMSNLRRLFISADLTPGRDPENQEGECWEILTSQMHHLRSLRQLYLDTNLLKLHLDQVLRCLGKPLDTLSITNCRLQCSDLTPLSQCVNNIHLKELCLRGTTLAVWCDSVCVLLEQSAATLQHLDLSLCGLLDSQLETILPALCSCSQLRSLSLYRNRLSMEIVKKLLCHTAGLPSLSTEVYPVPLKHPHQCEERVFQDDLESACAELWQHLRGIGKPRSILVSNNNQCDNCAQMTLRNGKLTVQFCDIHNYHSKEISFQNLEGETFQGNQA